MKIRYLLTSKYEQLRDSVRGNLLKYTSETQWIDSFFDEDFDAETPVEAFLPGLIESSKSDSDFDNVKILYSALKHLTPEQAADGRLWAHLTHVEYWKYMRTRWGIDSNKITNEETEEAEEKNQKLAEQIKGRYFFSSDANSRSLIRNGIARLWWFGYLTYDSHNTEDHFVLTKTLLDYQDTQMQLLERTFGKNPEVLKVCLSVLAHYMPSIRGNGGRDVIQKLAKYVNLLGGTYFLDTMDKEELKNKITTFIERKLQE